MGLSALSFIWLVLIFLATIGPVKAADCAPASSTFTIKTSQDVTDISACSTFVGNIVVAADGPDQIALDGITNIDGNFDVENVAKLRSLSSASLAAVSSLTLNNLPQLSNLKFPSLSNFSSLKWYNLPALEDTTIATVALRGEIQDITVYNTSLKNLDWLKWPVAAQLNISSNSQLEKFAIPYNQINGGCAISISSNPALTTFDFSSIHAIYGGLAVHSNPNVTKLSFDLLFIIGGYVQLNGNFANVTMPRLNNINGALSVRSTDDISALCTYLGANNLAGHYDCTPNIAASNPSNANPVSPSASPISPSTTPLATAPPSSNPGLSTGAKIGLGFAALAISILILLGALFYYRYRIRSQIREIEPRASPTPSNSDRSKGRSELESPALAEATTSQITFASELESPARPLEIYGSKERLELQGSSVCGELETPTTPGTPAWKEARWSAGSRGQLVRAELPG